MLYDIDNWCNFINYNHPLNSAIVLIVSLNHAIDGYFLKRK